VGSTPSRGDRDTLLGVPSTQLFQTLDLSEKKGEVDLDQDSHRTSVAMDIEMTRTPRKGSVRIKMHPPKP
jgi:hypothetical protein